MIITTKSLRSSLIGLFVLISVAPCCHSRAFHSPLLDLQRSGTIQRKLPNAVTVALSLQGGGAAKKVDTPKKKNTKTKATADVAIKEDPKQASSAGVQKNAAVIVGTALMSYVMWVYRASWMGLFDKEMLLEKTLEILHHLDAQPKYISFPVYMLGMAFWEALGLSTIPVETASGMVFGWTGFALSGVGKLVGAVLAFCLARYGVLAAYIQEKLSSNQVLKLLEESSESHPLRVAFLIKLSCFPETIKNYGSSLLHPIRLWMFTVGTMVHGWTFSALWTYLGVDTAMRLKDPSIPIDGKLQILLTMAIINGVVVSPLAMGFWIKSLKKPKELQVDEKEKGPMKRLKK